MSEAHNFWIAVVFAFGLCWTCFAILWVLDKLGALDWLIKHPIITFTVLFLIAVAMAFLTRPST